MRTTIYLDEELYSNLIKESIERYGSTKKLSVVINMFLKEFLENKQPKVRKSFRGFLGNKPFSDMSDIRDRNDRSF